MSFLKYIFTGSRFVHEFKINIQFTFENISTIYFWCVFKQNLLCGGHHYLTYFKDTPFPLAESKQIAENEENIVIVFLQIEK